MYHVESRNEVEATRWQSATIGDFKRCAVTYACDLRIAARTIDRLGMDIEADDES